jgi:hypothetical protein
MLDSAASRLKVCEMLNTRYSDLKNGRVKPIDGEPFFDNFRRREDELLNKHSPQ